MQMNKKKQGQLTRKQAAAKKPSSAHPYNNLEDWLGADFSKPPESEEWVKDFQRRIDNAFGAEGLFVLAWSGDQSYWEEFACDWYANGTAKTFEKRPIMLWAEIPVDNKDYIYIYPPRWMILEKWHPVQYAPNWESSVWEDDDTMLGGRKQIRPKNPPKDFYGFWKSVERHSNHTAPNGEPVCCVSSLRVGKLCYGEYRKPDDSDLLALSKMRKDMDKRNAQRPDEPLQERTLEEARLNSRHYRQRSKEQKAEAVLNLGKCNPNMYLGNLEKDHGIKLSAREKEAIVTEALTKNIEEEMRQNI